jgi:mono/diheme cytochrome c family protein
MRWTRWTATLSALAALIAVVATLSCASNAQQAAPAALTQEQKVERGLYLTTIMGCNDCHTPGTFYGAPDFERKLSGSELGWSGPWGTTYARNLTPDATGLAAWSEDDIVKALRTGMRPDGTEILPPMPWPMYTNLSDDDAHSIAAYLKSLPAVSHKMPDKLPPGSKTAANDWILPKPLAWDAPKAAAADSAAGTH